MRAGLFLMIVFILQPTFGRAEVLKYIDENGAVAFTDNIENVPEALRSQIEKIEPEIPPALSEPVLPAQEFARQEYERWIDHPLAKYAFGFILLSIAMFYVQRRTKSFLLGLVMKLLFVGFLGAAIYSVLSAQDKAITPAALQKAAEPFLPTSLPMTQAKEAVKKMEEAQKKQAAAMESLMGE